MKKSVIAASGGYAVGLWLQWEETEIWRLLETVELVALVQEEMHRK